MLNSNNPHYLLTLDLILKLRSIESDLVEYAQRLEVASEDNIRCDLDSLFQQSLPQVIKTFPELCVTIDDQLNHVENILTSMVLGNESKIQEAVKQLDSIFKTG